MKYRVFFATGVVFLSSCAAVPQIPKEVKVPVPVPCVTEIPVQPSGVSTDRELKQMLDGDLILTLAKDRLILRAYAGELRAVLEACVSPRS